jgi:polyphosphate kinase
VLFPLQSASLRDRVIHEILAAYLADTAKSRWLQKDGDYLRYGRLRNAKDQKPPRPHTLFNAQEFLIGVAEGKCSPDQIPLAPERRRSSEALVQKG